MLQPSAQSRVRNIEELHERLDQHHRDSHSRLGHYLIDTGVLAPEQLTRLLERQHDVNRRLGEIIVDQGLVTHEQLAELLARQLDIPRVHLDEFEPDPALLQLVSESVARRYHVMPLMLHNDCVVVATETILQQDVLESLRFITERNILQALAEPGSIDRSISEHYLLQQIDGDDLAHYELSLEHNEDDNRIWQEAEQMAKQQPIVKLVDSMMANAIAQKTSDIHILPGRERFDLLYRIDGTLVKVRDFPKSLLPAVVSRIKIISRLNIAERRLPQDGRICFNDKGLVVDLRVSIIPVRFGESIVIRLLNKNAGLRSLAQIGFSGQDEARLRDLLDRSHGIILVTGPTGSGKSTTLYAALQEVAKTNVNVVTVEDPIEYEMPGMRQIQLIPSINFSFPQALRHILRHDPDVVMIGEMRDLETAKIAVESALTGHLVFSTLHTNDAPSTIVRLLEMGIEPYMIRAALIGVLAQRLIRKNCQHCLVEDRVTPLMLSNLGLSTGGVFYRGAGCEHCHRTGFSGRVAVYELLILDENVRNLVRRGASADEIRSVAVRQGMSLMHHNGISLARQKLVSLNEIYRSCM